MAKKKKAGKCQDGTERWIQQKLDFQAETNQNTSEKRNDMNEKLQDQQMEKYKSVNIKISDITIDSNRRPVGNIDSLTRDIEEIGLIYPVVLSPDMKLVAGARRIASYLRLERDHIPAVIKGYNEIEAKIAEISDNLEHKPLNAMEKVRAVALQQDYYQALHPETSKKAKAAANLRKTDLPSENEAEHPTFTKHLADLVDKEQRTVQGWIKVGQNLNDEICARLKGKQIEDNFGDLKQLSEMSDGLKMQAVEMLESGVFNKIREFKTYICRQYNDNRCEPAEPIEGEDFIFSASIALGRYEDEIKHITDGSVNLALTDPPYRVGKKKKGKETWDEIFDVIPFMTELNRVLNKNGSALIFCTDQLLPDYLKNPCGLHLRQILHWHKTNRKSKPADGITGTRKYLDTIEYILWYVKSETSFTFKPDKINEKLCGKTQTAYFTDEEVDENDDTDDSKDNIFISGICTGGERLTDDNGDSLHPCQKPYALIESLLLTHSNRGDMVIDPFTGSGTVAECAARWERSFCGSELDEEYHTRANMRIKLALGYTTFKEQADEWDEAYANDEVIREPIDWTEEKRKSYINTMARIQQEFLNRTLPERFQKSIQSNIDAGCIYPDFMAMVDNDEYELPVLNILASQEIR